MDLMSRSLPKSLALAVASASVEYFGSEVDACKDLK